MNSHIYVALSGILKRQVTGVLKAQCLHNVGMAQILAEFTIKIGGKWRFNHWNWWNIRIKNPKIVKQHGFTVYPTKMVIYPAVFLNMAEQW